MNNGNSNNSNNSKNGNNNKINFTERSCGIFHKLPQAIAYSNYSYN